MYETFFFFFAGGGGGKLCGERRPTGHSQFPAQTAPRPGREGEEMLVEAEVVFSAVEYPGVRPPGQ